MGRKIGLTTALVVAFASVLGLVWWLRQREEATEETASEQAGENRNVRKVA